MRKISGMNIQEYKIYLIEAEKSGSTQAKYIRDISAFALWLKDDEATRARVIEYKSRLIDKYAPASVNSKISSLNSFFDFMGWSDCKVKSITIQKQIFADKNKELTKAEYTRLLHAARDKRNKRLYYLMQTICSLGLRVSELKYVDVNAVMTGRATINCKGKMRIVILPKSLCKMLKGYIKERRITSGSIFVSRNGKPLDRSNIWKMLKTLCDTAGVSSQKVFPHNLRHLFARTYYSVQRDIVRLADILGHCSINTTRIYTMESGEVHRKTMEKLGLLIDPNKTTT